MSELETFVLGYVEEMGGLVEPAGYDTHELLLPESVAERWQAPAYQLVTFAEQEEDGVKRLGYNHPLVEQMVAEAHHRPASTCLYINDLRLDKSGVEELATKGWVVVNGRVTTQKRATVARVRSTYVRFNFKAALLSDEKQERLVSVLMDAHAGHRVEAAGEIEGRATATEPGSLLRSLPDAPVRWQPPGGKPLKAPLNQRTLEALLERAQTAVLQEMSADLKTLQKRVARFRELDEARLTEYYANLERDLQQRLKTASAERRPGLEDKLEAVQTERAHKLADLAERYQVRINLSLVNLLVIQQPKLIVPVNIGNRTTTISAYAVWDPLRHHLEPLVCRVCGLPSRRTYLCYNGHLAHEDCLAPACIDCKRVFCQACAHEIGECDVCHESLCRHSRIKCTVCGRGTCQAHVDLCHANDGRPVDLTPQAEAPQEPEPEPEPPPPPPKRKTKTPPRTQSRSRPAPRVKPSLTRPSLPKGVPKPVRIEVILYSTAVAAIVLASRERQIAQRVWELDPEEGGIIRTCECEKGEACRANNMILRPSETRSIEKQLFQEITALGEEYGLPVKKINFNHLSALDGTPVPTKRFELTGLWKNEEVLEKARATFARIYWK